MGGIPCEIIVACGAGVKSKASALLQYPYALIKPVSAELETLEGEICDLGPELGDVSEQDKAAIIANGEASWVFGQELQEWMDAHVSDLTHPRSDREHGEDVKQLRARLRAFADAQAAFFHDLVSRYR